MRQQNTQMVEFAALSKLKDDEFLMDPCIPAFDYLTKKAKIQMINFNKNTSKQWIFPFKNQEHDNTYKFTEPHPEFLKVINAEEIKHSLKDISLISQKYYDERFQKEQPINFPKFPFGKISIILSMFGFFALMGWTQNALKWGVALGDFANYFSYVLMIPWC